MNIRLLIFRIRTSLTALIKAVIHFLGMIIFGFFLGWENRTLSMPRNGSFKILYICLSYRGDFILNFPILKAIKREFPKATITCWVRGYCDSLAKLNPHIDDVIVFDNYVGTGIGMIGLLLHLNYRSPLVRTIKSKEFDLSIDDSGYGFSAVVTCLAGIPYRIGRNLQGFGFLNHYEVPLAPNSHLLDKRLHLLKPLGISEQISKDLFPSIDIPTLKVEETAKRYGLKIEAGSYFTIQPFGGWEAKNWDEGKFAQVIREFGRANVKTPLFIGGIDDFEGIARIADRIGLDCINTAGRVDLAESAILISGACLHLGVDSFGSQFAAAVGVKSLTLFGPTNPRLIAFLGPNNVAVMKKTSCSPRPDKLYCCPDAGRSCRLLTCMKELQADHVLGILQELWEGNAVEGLVVY